MPAQFETISALFQLAGVGPSITVPAPSGLLAGEFLVAIGAVFGEPAVITLPAGWSKDDEQSVTTFPTGFVASKRATADDVAAGSFLFSQNLGGSEAWTIGIFRFSSAGGLDSLITNFFVGGTSTVMTAPKLTPSVPDVLAVRAHQTRFTTAEPSSITPANFTTLQAFVGGPNVGPGSADPFGVYLTDDRLYSPPGQQPANVPEGTFVGASGSKFDVPYVVGILPLGGGTPGGVLRETVERGTQIKNPFGGRMRRNACMCIGKCNCS